MTKQAQKVASKRLQLARKNLAEQLAQGYQLEALFEEPSFGYHASMVISLTGEMKMNLYGDDTDPAWLDFVAEMQSVQEDDDDTDCALCGGTGLIFY